MMNLPDRLERVRNQLVRLRGTLWLLPAVVSLLFLALAVMLLAMAPVVRVEGGGPWWLFGGDADTARNLLGTLTSAMITMTSLVVSITVVVLTLAANQFGPRLVNAVMGDRQIQLVLGLFIGTIIYLVTVLRSISGTQEFSQVPHLAVTVGTILSVLCLFALLYYVHKVARSIIADTVIDRVARDLGRSVRANLPERTDEPRAAAGPPHGELTRAIALGRTGYIQVVDHAALVAIAHEHDLRLRIDVRAGNFVLAAGRHVHVGSDLDDELVDRIRGSFVIGTERTPTQDVELAIRQLVEIALRALSPGINDPFTAVTVIHRLGGELAAAFTRVLPPSVYHDEAGVPRLQTSPPTFDDLLATAFEQIRAAAADHAVVRRELQATLEALLQLAETPEQRRALACRAGNVAQEARRADADGWC